MSEDRKTDGRTHVRSVALLGWSFLVLVLCGSKKKVGPTARRCRVEQGKKQRTKAKAGYTDGGGGRRRGAVKRRRDERKKKWESERSKTKVVIAVQAELG